MTGDAKYMALAKRFTHHVITDPLAAGRDQLTGRHANTQVPKLIGAARIYDLTGDDYYGRASAFFWQTVVDHRTFATGGNGDSEHFFDPAAAGRHLSSSTAETCNVYNMLKLTRALYARDPKPEYADYAERATFNQILGSMDPRRGMVTYHQSLKPGVLRSMATRPPPSGAAPARAWRTTPGTATGSTSTRRTAAANRRCRSSSSSRRPSFGATCR